MQACPRAPTLTAVPEFEIVVSRTMTPTVRPAAGAALIPFAQLFDTSTRLTITVGSVPSGARRMPAFAFWAIVLSSIRTLRALRTWMPLTPW